MAINEHEVLIVLNSAAPSLDEITEYLNILSRKDRTLAKVYLNAKGNGINKSAIMLVFEEKFNNPQSVFDRINEWWQGMVETVKEHSGRVEESSIEIVCYD